MLNVVPAGASGHQASGSDHFAGICDMKDYQMHGINGLGPSNNK
jgi:hypothetical protein